jgi:hypothetical protein
MLSPSDTAAKLDTATAYQRMYIVCLAVAMHLGLPVDDLQYNPQNDKRVWDFIEQATTWQVGMESQQIAELDKLDRQLA